MCLKPSCATHDLVVGMYAPAPRILSYFCPCLVPEVINFLKLLGARVEADDAAVEVLVELEVFTPQHRPPHGESSNVCKPCILFRAWS